jgi:hypothetical protein
VFKDIQTKEIPWSILFFPLVDALAEAVNSINIKSIMQKYREIPVLVFGSRDHGSKNGFIFTFVRLKKITP